MPKNKILFQSNGYFHSVPVFIHLLLLLTVTSFLQAASPACTELEVVMMDWLAKMLQLPEEFMSGGKGGGVIQVTGLT